VPYRPVLRPPTYALGHEAPPGLGREESRWSGTDRHRPPGQNPFLADVLGRFADRTGIPVLINTSLNVKGKPICGTPQMALECLASSGLDGLMLGGDWWVTR